MRCARCNTAAVRCEQVGGGEDRIVLVVHVAAQPVRAPRRGLELHRLELHRLIASTEAALKLAADRKKVRER
jgi:hypothetical protein